MPYRLIPFWTVLIGLLGVIILGVLIATRRDWRRTVAASTGWKRKLLVAGLAMLAISAPTVAADEGRTVTCYMVVIDTNSTGDRLDVDAALDQLDQRMALLEATLEAETLDPDVAAATLSELQAELAELEASIEDHDFTDAQLNRLAQLRQQADERAEQLDARLASPADTELTELQDTEEWQRISAAWELAEATAGVGRLDTEDEKQAILAEIDFDGRFQDIATLANLDLLSNAEYHLLLEGMMEMSSNIAAIIPVEEQMTCYAAMPPGPSAWSRAEQQLPLLEAVVSQGVVDPAVAERILEAIDDELAVLEAAGQDGLATQARWLASQSEGELTEAQAAEQLTVMREQYFEMVELLHERQAGESMSLTDTPLWQNVDATWQEAQEVADAMQIATEAEKQALMASIQDALMDVATLGEAGQLSAVEAQVLDEGLVELRARISGIIPSDVQMMMCYDMGPALQGVWHRVDQVVPLLEALAESETVHPAVIEKALQSVEDELAESEDDGWRDVWAQRVAERDGCSREQAQATMDEEIAELVDVVVALQTRLAAAQEEDGR